MPVLLRDLQLAIRMLRRSPTFTIVAVLVLSIGIGAVTTIGSAANALALRPLPGVPDADELVEVYRTLGDGTGATWASYPYARELRDRDGVPSVPDVAAWAMMPVTIATGREGVAAQGTIVSANYFAVLRTRPTIGRFFTPDEDGAALATPVVVLSHAFWTTRLAGDPQAVGRTVRLNGAAFTVVGVAPPGFHGVFPALRTDAWVPLGAQARLRPGSDVTDPRPTWLQLFARVPGGGVRAAVGQAFARRTREFVATANESAEDRRFTSARVVPLAGLPSDLNGRVVSFMALLLGASGLVLLIASNNVAAMSLARAVGRRRETAVRFALGATRGRLVRQLLTESVLLSLLGAGGGVLLAAMAARLLTRVPPPIDTPFALDVTLDARVLAFTVAVALVTGVGAGLAPALRAADTDVDRRLRTDTAGAGSRRGRPRGMLIAGQMAVSLPLLIAAGLFLRALERGRRVDLGFDPTHVAVAGFDVGTYGYGDAAARHFYDAVRDAMARTPGVVGVTYARDLPLSMRGQELLQLDGVAGAPADGGRTPVRAGEVDAGFFDVVRLPVVQGRAFVASDDERAPRIAIVNEAFVRRFWPTGAVGRTFRRAGVRVTVVGVARDTRDARPGAAPGPFVYFALAQAASPTDHAELLVRTTGDPATLAPAIRAAVHDVDPLVPPPAATTLAAAVGRALLPQRVAALVTGVLGGVGLLLAAVGLYGIVAYLVGQRTREIGVRLALGAAPGDVSRLVVGEGMRPVLAGLALGLLVAMAGTRVLRAFLFGVSPLDALAFGGGAALLVVVALAATYLPARRAAAADPVRALRAE